MEQQHFRRTSSIRVRLLLSTVTLLVVVIGFFAGSTIFLMRADKRASTYQAKTSEAVLAGREFARQVGRVLESIRLSLDVNGGEPAEPRDAAALRELLRGVPEASSISLIRLDPKTGPIERLAWAERPRAAGKGAAVRGDDANLDADRLRPVLDVLRHDGHALVNVTGHEGPVAYAVLLPAAPRAPGSDGSLTLLVAIVPLDRFANEMRGHDLTIATRRGEVLFDSDPVVLRETRSRVDSPLFVAATSGRAEAGALDFRYRGHRYVGAFSTADFGIVALARAERADVMAPIAGLTLRLAAFGLIAILAGAAAAAWFARTLTAPILRLVEATRQVATGNFLLKLKVVGADEIAQLTEAFNTMSAKIKELFQDSVEKIMLESEVDVAAIVQQTLIPPTEYRGEGIEIDSAYHAASRVGGDWWGYFRDGQRVVVAIGDATGHGLPSALITAAARAWMSLMQKRAEQDPLFMFSPNEMLSYANQVVWESSHGNIQLTLFVCVIDLGQKTVTYANAGHNPPWLFRKTEGGGYRAESLAGTGIRLGEQRETHVYEERNVPIASGDVIFLYTDGLIDSEGEGSVSFSKRRVRKTIEAHLAEGPPRVIDELLKNFNAVLGAKAAEDDVTIAMVRLT